MLKTTLASKIMDEMQRYKKGVSFVEFTRFAGPEANGDRMLCVPDHPNLVLWAGLSSDFIDAFNDLMPRLKLVSLTNQAALMIYSFDGKIMTLPFVPDDAEDIKPDVDYWLPVTVSLREA